MINYLFDFDGTLITELKINYLELKNKLKELLECDYDINLSPMVDKIYEFAKDKKTVNRCFRIIDEFEEHSLKYSSINNNIMQLYLDSKYKIIISRNGLNVINKFFVDNKIPYPDLICCRDNCKYLKPNIEHLYLVFDKYPNLNNNNVCIIGDSWHDKELAKNINCNYLYIDLKIKQLYYKMRIFITGGAGFIGSNLVKNLLEKKCYDITVYDNLSTVNCGINNIKDFIDNKSINFINGDILDEKCLISSMTNHDIVIHLAAQLEVTASYNNPIYDLNINLIGTINVINACIKNKINRLINASSACVYGFTDGSASLETDNTNPNWEYGISKLAAEKYIQIAHNTHNINFTSLRFSIVYGINEWYGRVLTIFIKRALENKDIVIFGDGLQARDYINVKDVCDFIYECIINENTYNKNYNVSSGQGITIKELADKVKNIFPNINILYENINEGELSQLVEGRVRLNQELKYLILNNEYALTTTNWYPKINFDEGLNQYIDWIKNNLNYWNSYKV